MRLNYALDGYWLAKARVLSSNTERDCRLSLVRFMDFIGVPAESFSKVGYTAKSLIERFRAQECPVYAVHRPHRGSFFAAQRIICYGGLAIGPVRANPFCAIPIRPVGEGAAKQPDVCDDPLMAQS
ncbi:MAG: hypothetical protein Kow0047_24840 [Anaerolineae bacterium]